MQPLSTGGDDDSPVIGSAAPGGLTARFLARLVDGVIVAVVGVFVALTTDVWSNILVTGLSTGALTFAYFVAFEVATGGTPGKRLLGLGVRGPGGTPKPTLRESAVRNAFTLLTIVPYVGGLLAFVAIVVIAVSVSGSPTKQGRHDELAGGTEVVRI